MGICFRAATTAHRWRLRLRLCWGGRIDDHGRRLARFERGLIYRSFGLKSQVSSAITVQGPFIRERMTAPEKGTDQMRKLLLAAAFGALSAAPALAELHESSNDGHWTDVRRHMSLEFMSDNSDTAARLVYARDNCRTKRDAIGGSIDARNTTFFACMKTQGYVFIFDTPTQVAAKQKAEQDARNRAQRIAVGQALSGFEDDLNRELNRPRPQSQRCNGNLYNGGSFNMTCN
jgi:hypothetical protein